MQPTNAQKILFGVKNLVFAGGGLRGIAILGVIQALRDEFGIDFGFRIPQLKNVAGVSIGCLFALCITLGYSVSEITEMSFRMNQSDILQSDPLRIISGQLSVDTGDKLKEFIENLLVRKKFSKTCTLQELYEGTNINFHVVVTNLTLGSVEHVTRELYPNLKVVKAILASMALPLVFPPVEAPNGDVWIDGGILENFPILKYNAQESLGIDFGWTLNNTKFENLPRLLLRIIQVMQVPSEICSWALLTDEHKNRTIKIHTGVSSALESALTSVDVPHEVRITLQRNGYEATKAKIKSWNKFENNNLKENSDPGEKLNSNRILPTYCKNVINGVSSQTRSRQEDNIADDARQNVQSE